MRKNPDSRLSPRASRLLQSARTAHLATADKSGQPHVVPICFVYDGKHFYSPIDEKPKRTANLKRLRNIAVNPNVALVIDHYEEDWRRLAYLLILGRAKLLHRGCRHEMAVRRLRRKYPPYRSMTLAARPLIVIRPRKFVSWQTSTPRAGGPRTAPGITASRLTAPMLDKRGW